MKGSFESSLNNNKNASQNEHEFLELESAIEACQEGIYICDKNLKCLRVNKAYTQITGMTESELVGKTSYQLVENGTISSSVGEMVLTENKTVSVSQTFRSGNKVLVTGQPVYDHNHQLFRIVITARDVTKLKELETDLINEKKRSERYLHELNQYKMVQKAHPELVANSRKMQEIIESVSRISQVDSPVLIMGESGTGKEVLAKLIHETKIENNTPFIKVNCGAIPGDLLESELFGYVKGAFTGANNIGKPGLFEIADNGTLFLDEIGEMPLNLQVKLLRVLQDHELTRLGSTKPKKVNFRLISATNRNLEIMLAEGKFRSDLYYRINVIPIHIPPLRERSEDIQPHINKTIDELYKKYKFRKSLSVEVLNILEEYNWPGNIRELKNLIERLYVMTEKEMITVEQLPSFIKSKAGTNKSSSLKGRVELYERQMIMDTLKVSKSLRQAASALKINPSTLSRKCQKYHIEL